MPAPAPTSPPVATLIGGCGAGLGLVLLTGPGLPLDMRVRLFQRFATGAVRKGNGLGLAMVARVARVHEARIQVDSEMGHGTAVTLLLPDRARAVA